jgi:D-amino-acid dehydrogenase
VSEGAAPPTLDHVVIVGAGLVGLSTAWFLQERGVRVTVIDRKGVAAGSSWGNAGWISPGLVLPLTDPAVLRYALKNFFDPAASLHVPLTFDPKLWLFLTDFARHCTNRHWRRAMESYAEITSLALGAYDALASGGVPAPTIDAPIMAAFEREEEARHLREELRVLGEHGQTVVTHDLSGAEARAIAPQLSDQIKLVVRLEGQRFFDPGAFAHALGDEVVKRGGAVTSGINVASLVNDATGVNAITSNGTAIRASAIVLATGSWLNDLAHQVGVRARVQAGRGYSMSVPTEQHVPNPLYFPTARVACTPYRGGLRVGGTMEFRSPNHPLDRRRVDAIVKSATPLLRGLDWGSRTDEWVGSRPVTADGLPLIGASANPRVFVAGGHGMWGIALGPATGQLLAEQIVTGAQPRALQTFSPLR